MTRKLKRTMQRAALAAGGLALAMGLSAGMAQAEGLEKPAFNVSADAVNKYVWRGLLTNEDPVIQPSVTATWYGLSLNVWGSVDTTNYGEVTGGYNDREWRFEEVDYTLSYTYALDAVSLTGGVVDYTFPGTPWEKTQEAFGTVALTNVPLTPTLSVYWDFDEVRGVYANFSLSHTVDLIKDKLNLALGASVGWDDENQSQFYYGVHQNALSDLGLSAQLNWTVASTLVVSPYVKYSEILDKDLRDVRDNVTDSGSALTVAGVRVAYSF